MNDIKNFDVFINMIIIDKNLFDVKIGNIYEVILIIFKRVG